MFSSVGDYIIKIHARYYVLTQTQLSNMLLDFICDFHPALINKPVAALLGIICNVRPYSYLSFKLFTKTSI